MDGSRKVSRPEWTGIMGRLQFLGIENVFSTFYEQAGKAKLRDGVRRAQEPYHKVDPSPRLASASGEPSGKPQSNVDSANGNLHPVAVAPATEDSIQGTPAV